MPEAEENESVLLGGKSALSSIEGSTLPETNSLPLKNGGWETTFSFWVSAYFQVRTASLTEGIPEDFFGDLERGSRDLQDDSLLIFRVTCHDQFQLGDCQTHHENAMQQKVFFPFPRMFQDLDHNTSAFCSKDSAVELSRRRTWSYKWLAWSRWCSAVVNFLSWKKNLDSSESRLYK